MDIADLDGDGLEDAVVCERTGQRIIYMRRPDSTDLHWKETGIDLPKWTGMAKAVKIGDVDGDGAPDIVHSSNTYENDNKTGVIWLSINCDATNPEWEWHDISGTVGYKIDRIELLDIDGDGDKDVLTYEENYGPDSHVLGVIWYENPYNVKSPIKR